MICVPYGGFFVWVSITLAFRMWSNAWLLTSLLTVYFICFSLWLSSLSRLRRLSRGFLRVGMTCYIAAFTFVSLAHAFDHSVRDSASTVASAHRHALLLSFPGPRPSRVTGCFVLAALFPRRLAPLPPLCSCFAFVTVCAIRCTWLPLPTACSLPFTYGPRP